MKRHFIFQLEKYNKFFFLLLKFLICVVICVKIDALSTIETKNLFEICFLVFTNFVFINFTNIILKLVKKVKIYFQNESFSYELTKKFNESYPSNETESNEDDFVILRNVIDFPKHKRCPQCYRSDSNNVCRLSINNC